MARLPAQIDTDLAGLLTLERRDPGASSAPTRRSALLRTAETYAVREDLWPLRGRAAAARAARPAGPGEADAARRSLTQTSAGSPMLRAGG